MSATLDSRYPVDVTPRFSLRGVFGVLLSRPRILGGAVLTGLLVGLLAAVIPDPKYTATASFAPQTRSGASSVAGIAAQLGVSVPSTAPSESPQFYADLLRSREILAPVVTRRYAATERADARGDLLRDWGRRGRTQAERVELATRELLRRLNADASSKTSVVSLSITTRSPQLSRDLLAAMIAEVNAFNLNKRRTQASAERDFAAQQLADASASLRAAEGELTAFLEANQALTSPRLQLAHDRLTREVAERQQLFAALQQSYEQAKLDAVRDSPVITVVEAPEAPALPDSRGVARKGALGAIVGFIVAALYLLGAAYVRGD